MNIDDVKNTEQLFGYCLYVVYKIGEIDTKNELANNKQKISKVIFPRRITNNVSGIETIDRIKAYFKLINIELEFTNDEAEVTFVSPFSSLKKDFSLTHTD